MEWKEVRLGEIASELSDGLHAAPQFVNGGDYIFVNAKNLKDGWIVDNDPTKKTTYEEFLKYRSPLNENTLLYSIDGTIGNIARYRGEKCVLGKGACYINPKSDIIDSDYLYYQLQSPHFRSYIDLMSTGSTIKHISLKAMRNYVFDLPSLEDQRRIANILSSLDRKIELNNKINSQLEEMAQTLFKHWFVDFGPFKDGKFVKSELGMIPEGWRVGTLTEIVELLPGGTPKTSEPSFWENGDIPFFSPKDVTGTYCFFTEKQITKLGLSKCSSRLYPKDTVFITCRGTVGKVTLAACNMAMNQSNYAIKGRDSYTQYYIYFLVKSVVEKLIKKSNGAVFSAITTKDFDEKVIIPSVESVVRFTKMISSHFDKLFSIGQENIQLAMLRDTLLPKLMSGEINLEDYGGE